MQVDISELRRKSPFKHFNDTSLKVLAEVADTTEHIMNDVIFSAGDEDKMSAFLIRGSVTLESNDGRVISIDHDHNMSQFALANLKPRMYKVTASTEDTVLFWVKDEVLDKVISERLQSQEIAVTSC